MRLNFSFYYRAIFFIRIVLKNSFYVYFYFMGTIVLLI
ncbi:hypothetical protein LEP1GSC109_1441 [Leptospira interrogans str. UI 13372]|nr:hypothetical protein LEP1GSC148_1716 [Leptospira interrogans serovar Canicola str. LT1962]EMO93394.1 hypothetical protein LEP1GSC109_1441 [Leptospira interrogans str. UI 13372]